MINDVDDTLSIILSFLSPQCSEVCRRWSRINDKQTFAALGMPLCSMCRERPWRDRLIRGVVYYSNMFPMHFGCFNATIASKTSSNAITENLAVATRNSQSQTANSLMPPSHSCWRWAKQGCSALTPCTMQGGRRLQYTVLPLQYQSVSSAMVSMSNSTRTLPGTTRPKGGCKTRKASILATSSNPTHVPTTQTGEASQVRLSIWETVHGASATKASSALIGSRNTTGMVNGRGSEPRGMKRSCLPSMCLWLVRTSSKPISHASVS